MTLFALGVFAVAVAARIRARHMELAFGLALPSSAAEQGRALALGQAADV